MKINRLENVCASQPHPLAHKMRKSKTLVTDDRGSHMKLQAAPILIFEIRTLRNFTNIQDYRAPEIIRLNNTVLALLGGRNSWVHIQNVETGRTIIRRALGAPKTRSLEKCSAEIDYDSRLTLGVAVRSTQRGTLVCRLRVRPARIHERMLGHWQHPDPSYRTSFRLGVLALAFAAFSILPQLQFVFDGALNWAESLFSQHPPHLAAQVPHRGIPQAPFSAPEKTDPKRRSVNIPRGAGGPRTDARIEPVKASAGRTN